ncbi:putative hydrolase C777.06c [Phragmites australis]|uniref:putative hydrolase C777.06c n=1 Tax=Phragmites australis TaxID=29695 RepID=UPI002D794DC0|nr:putative hydrolase C777.06c [Phragmites australis]
MRQVRKVLDLSLPPNAPGNPKGPLASVPPSAPRQAAADQGPLAVSESSAGRRCLPPSPPMPGAGAGAGAIASALLRAHVPLMPPPRAFPCLAAARLPFLRARAATASFPFQSSSSPRLPLLPRLCSARSFCGVACASPGGAGSDPAAEQRPQESELIFLGTGTSEGIPRVSCLTHPTKTCPVCTKASKPENRNRRRNTSILLRHATSSGTANILVDAGKFFYHSALQWFPTFGLRTIDAVIITHSHADAIGGLDCLRDWTNNVQPSIPIYVVDRDYEVMKMTHYYLIDTSVVIPGAAVSALQFNIIKEEPFMVHNLEVIPLPVWHGQGYRSLGFRFGDICYISDVSDIPKETYELLENCELLILDALRPDRSSSTHFGLPRALDEVRKIKPKKTLFTGMMHLMDHEKVNNDLARLMETEGLDIQLSYDGLRIPVRL